MNDPDQTATCPPGIGDDPPQRLSGYDASVGIDEPPSAVVTTARLVSLGFLWAALRRRAGLWCVLALVGLVVGYGYYVAVPHAHQATASVLLADYPGMDSDNEVQTDMALAQSAPVAAGVIRQLGLRGTPSSLLGTYTVTKVTDQVLLITVSAPTSNGAVQTASAVAEQFLMFRAQYWETQQQETNSQLGQQVNDPQQHLASITKQMKQISAQSTISRAQQAELYSLHTQEMATSDTLDEVRQYAIQTKASTQTATQEVVQGSEMLSAASLVKSSHLAGMVLYAGGGLLGGLALGLAIVIIGAITSDRLRRRDDIAYAFGAPVRLSVGSLREGRLVLDLGGGATRCRRMERVVEHLRNAALGSSSRPVGLAVVAVDDARTVAQAVVDLAVSSAKGRGQVVLADLSQGAHAARLLGIDRPGIGTASADGMHIVVVVPEANDVAPVGPLRSHTSPEEDTQVSERGTRVPEGNTRADEALASICARADLVLSLVTLDPASGGEHLATWATDVVAVVTAGQSTAVRIHAVGEMIRLAGARFGSVVVIGADKSDESLGVIDTAYSPAPL